jgi:hypothetical protein
MDILKYKESPYRSITDPVDRAHRLLPPGSYYVTWHSARYLRRRQRGVHFLVYFRNHDDGCLYCLGVTYGSPGFRECRDYPRNSIMFVTIGHTKSGYMEFRTLEPVYRPNPLFDGTVAAKALNLHVCASRPGPLRIPFLRRIGTRERPIIMIIAPWPTVSLSRSHFSSDDELHSCLSDAPKFRTMVQTLGAEPNEFEAFETQIERLFWDIHPAPVNLNLFPGGVVVRSTEHDEALARHFGWKIEPPQPVPTLIYTWLCPSPFAQGDRAARTAIPPAEWEVGAKLLRILFRRFKPDLVVVSGTETVRRLPEILSRLPHRAPFKLRQLRKAYQWGVNSRVWPVVQEFGVEKKKWRSDFVAVPDLRFFGQANIHRQKLRKYLWGDLLHWLKCSVYACIWGGPRWTPNGVPPLIKSHPAIELPNVGT